MLRQLHPLIVFYLLCSFFLSCEEAEIPDTEAPKISIVNPIENRRVSPTNYIFNSSGLSDYLELSGAGDYQNKIVFSSDNVLRWDRDLITTTSALDPASSTGGRTSSLMKVAFPVKYQQALSLRLPHHSMVNWVK